MRRLRPKRVALWLYALGIVAAVSFHGLAVYRDYGQAIRQHETLVSTTTRALGEQMGDILRLIDAGVSSSAALAGTIGWDSPEARTTLHDFLVDWQLHSPSTYAFWVTDATGTLVVTSSFVDPPPIDLADRFAVRRQLEGEGGLVIGHQIRGRFNLSHDRPIVNVTKPVTNADGELVGVAAASLAVDYVLGIHRTLNLPAGGVVSVVAPHGGLIAHTPWNETLAEVSLAGHPLMEEWLPNDDHGVVRMTYLTDRIERISAYDRVDPYGVAVLVGIDMATVLAPWRHELWWNAASLAVVLAILTLLTAATVQSYARWERGLLLQEARQRAIAAASERLIGAATVPGLFDLLVEGIETVLARSQADVRWTRPDPHGVHRNATPETSDGGAVAIELAGNDGRVAGLIDVRRRAGETLSPEDRAVVEQLARVATTALHKLELLEDRRVALEASEASRRQLDASHAKIDTIFRSISDAVYSLDHEWRFTYLNPRACELLRGSCAELIDRSLWETVGPSAASELRPVYEDAIATGEERSTDLFYAAFGEWHAIRAFPHADGLTVYFRDVTERVRAEAELRQAHKMDAIGQLTGGVAHDFNNLLTVILGNLEMLADAPGLDASDRKAIDLAVKACEQAAHLTAQLLAFARRQPLAPRPVDVQQLVRDWDAVLARALGPGIAVELDFAPKLPAALVDPVQLQNALLNLALNARDAMAGHGRLEVEVGAVDLDRAACEELAAEMEPGTFVRIEVRDDGSGMSPEVRERAFDPFFTTKSQGRGSGLGLAMVYGFARQSGGHVALRSTPGQGTSVVLYLPAAAMPAHAAPQIVDGGALVGGEERVLLVEDEPAVLAWLERALVQLGYHVESATDAAGALSVLQRDTPVDLLLTDVGLPGGVDGLALARTAARLRPGIRVLFASGNAAAALAEGATLPPESNFLQKPVHFTELAKAIRRSLDGPTAERG